MKTLLFKLDFSFLEFIHNIEIKIGKENSLHILKVN